MYTYIYTVRDKSTLPGALTRICTHGPGGGDVNGTPYFMYMCVYVSAEYD